LERNANAYFSAIEVVWPGTITRFTLLVAMRWNGLIALHLSGKAIVEFEVLLMV
jgi:hypothetical protein